MRICPKCRTQFTDKSLVFCLQDGARLVEGAEDKTEQCTGAELKNAETLAVERDQIASVTSSSIQKQDAENLYIPKKATDNNDRTGWCEGVPGAGVGEWIKIECTKELELAESKIKPGYFKNATVWRKNRVASIKLLFSNGLTRVFDFPDEMRSQTVPWNGVESRFIEITLRETHNESADQKDTLISEIALTGSA